MKNIIRTLLPYIYLLAGIVIVMMVGFDSIDKELSYREAMRMEARK